MDKPQHTPGPWAAWQRESDKGTNYWVFRTAPEMFGMQDNLRGYCGEANANLIAAAPELLESAKAVMAYLDLPAGSDSDAAHELCSRACRLVKAAIELAEGGRP